jgi:hypothetical protein
LVMSQLLQAIAENRAQLNKGDSFLTQQDSVDELGLVDVVATLTVNLVFQWPISIFVAQSQLNALGENMRFLLLLTTNRWTAEYCWLHYISNDAHRVQGALKQCARKGGSGGAGAYWFAGEENAKAFKTSASNRPKSTAHADKSVAYVNTAATKNSTLKASEPVSESDIELLRIKKSCRFALCVWLHCITAVSNVFMAQIHRTLWPAFEEQLQREDASWLDMQYVFSVLLTDICSSLSLLRTEIVHVAVAGFAASSALRRALGEETVLNRPQANAAEPVCVEEARTRTKAVLLAYNAAELACLDVQSAVATLKSVLTKAVVSAKHSTTRFESEHAKQIMQELLVHLA